jgi:hypothetical protein
MILISHHIQEMLVRSYWMVQRVTNVCQQTQRNAAQNSKPAMQNTQLVTKEMRKASIEQQGTFIFMLQIRLRETASVTSSAMLMFLMQILQRSVGMMKKVRRT